MVEATSPYPCFSTLNRVGRAQCTRFVSDQEPTLVRKCLPFLFPVWYSSYTGPLTREPVTLPFYATTHHTSYSPVPPQHIEHDFLALILSVSSPSLASVDRLSTYPLPSLLYPSRQHLPTVLRPDPGQEAMSPLLHQPCVSLHVQKSRSASYLATQPAQSRMGGNRICRYDVCCYALCWGRGESGEDVGRSWGAEDGWSRYCEESWTKGGEGGEGPGFNCQRSPRVLSTA